MPTTQQIPFIFPFPPALAPAMSQDPVPYISLNFLQPPVVPTSSLTPAHFSSATSSPLHALPFPTLYCHPNSYSLNLSPLLSFDGCPASHRSPLSDLLALSRFSTLTFSLFIQKNVLSDIYVQCVLLADRKNTKVNKTPSLPRRGLRSVARLDIYIPVIYL